MMYRRSTISLPQYRYVLAKTVRSSYHTKKWHHDISNTYTYEYMTGCRKLSPHKIWSQLARSFRCAQVLPCKATNMRAIRENKKCATFHRNTPAQDIQPQNTQFTAGSPHKSTGSEKKKLECAFLKTDLRTNPGTSPTNVWVLPTPSTYCFDKRCTLQTFSAPHEMLLIQQRNWLRPCDAQGVGIST